MDSIKFETISLPMIILLILTLGMIIFILIIEPRFNKKRLTNKNEHGSSKFADIKEIKNNFQKESLNNINKVGFPVWYEKKNNKFESVYFDVKSPHYLLVGSTGAGKSVTVSIPTSIHFATAKEKHSVVLTDPKGELFKTTGKIFEDNGYDVITIDFRNPTKSAKINIMQPIIDEWKEHCKYYKFMMLLLTLFMKNNSISFKKIYEDKYLQNIGAKFNLEDYIIDAIKNNIDELIKYKTNKKLLASELSEIDESINLDDLNNDELLSTIKKYQNESAKHQAETNRLVISLANLIFTEKESKDPFWVNAAKQLFIGIVGIFIEDYKNGLIDENKINISSIKKFQNSSLTKENQIYLQRNLNLREYGSLSKDYLTSIISSAENTYKSITAIFGEKMSIFDDLNVENITSISDFKFTDVEKKPTVLYIIVPDEDRSYFQLVTIIVGMLIKDLTKFANLPENNGSLPIKVEWILDEFANCPPLDSIETVVSVARSRGMRFFFFIQSFSQLDQVYGKEIANIIQDNCALVYLKTNTVETAEVIAKKLGKETVETKSLSMSTDPLKVGGNQTKSLMGKELLTANEIIGLKYKTIIFPTFGNPIFRDTYMYSDIYPQYKNCPICERENKVLKRLTENYYTVEKLKELYDRKIRENNEKFSKKIEQTFKRKAKNILSQEVKELDKGPNNDDILINSMPIRNYLKDKIENERKNEYGGYVIELKCLLNKFEFNRLLHIKDSNIFVMCFENIKLKKTVIILYNKEFMEEENEENEEN